MSEYGLDLHCQMIMEEYNAMLPQMRKMQEIVEQQLHHIVDENHLYVNAIESRIKSEESLAGKLLLKGAKYMFLSDITDILGARVITFYTDEVDKVAALVEKHFEVDWDNSVDKRKIYQLNSFGYMSLHYICRIPRSLYYDEQHPEINEMRFEVQMRTALQHVWAVMNHDTGYKSGVEVPYEHLRNLTRLAGMLELADEQFSRIRREITDYRRRVQGLVSSGNFDEVPLNGDTYRSYLSLHPFQQLVEKIAAINQAEIINDNLMPYYDVFVALDFKSLGDIERMKTDYGDAAYQLSVHQIGSTDLDIMAASVAVLNLCAVYILKMGGGVKGLERLYNAMGGTPDANAMRAQNTFSNAQRINLV